MIIALASCGSMCQVCKPDQHSLTFVEHFVVYYLINILLMLLLLCELRRLETEPFRQETVFPALAPGAAEQDLACPPVFHDAAPYDLNTKPVVSDYAAATTSLCAFEICPRQVYTINFTHCDGDGEGQLALFSYSDGQALGRAACGATLYVDNAGFSSCRLVTMYQTCMLDSSTNASTVCSGGQVLIRGEVLPAVNITFSAAHFVAGEAVAVNISPLSTNEGYLSWLSSSASSTALVLALYQSELLSLQTSCNFYSVAQDDLVDYLDKVGWDGRGGSVVMPHHVVSEFVSSLKVVLWAHGSSRGVSHLGESADVRVHSSASVSLDVAHFARGSHVAGTWGFGSQAFHSQPGDVIALYRLDSNGTNACAAVLCWSVLHVSACCQNWCFVYIFPSY